MNNKLRFLLIGLIAVLLLLFTGRGLAFPGSGNSASSPVSIASVPATSVSAGEAASSAESLPSEPASLPSGPESSVPAESEPASLPESSPESQPAEELRTYTMEDLENLERTENFKKSAIEHIFCGSVNSNGNGSGYHYNMIEDTPGVIVEGTRSEEDEHGLYKANIEVDGHPKVHYSTFFPDSWSPQEVVDAINAARQDALDNGRNPRDTTWVGYYEGIEIDMYLNGKNKIISAYPIYAGDRGAMG